MDLTQAIQLNARKYGYVADIESVSPEIQDFLNSEGITILIGQICQKYGLPPKTQYDVVQLIVWYVSKQLPEQEFINLLSLAPLQSKFFPLFLHDLQDKLWDPYDAALNLAKIPYKLLTKLNPESPEKIRQWLEGIEKQYPEQPVIAEPQGNSAMSGKEFSLGDQIKIFANQNAAQPAKSPEIKITVPDTSFAPPQPQTAKPIEITVSQPQTTPQQPLQHARTTEQPAPQVRLEISSSPAAPLISDQAQPPEQPSKQSAAFTLPSIRFEPLLQKQEGVVPKQATPSAVLQEALGVQKPPQEQENAPHLPVSQQPASSQGQTGQTEVPKQSGNVIDLTNWNVTK